MVERQLKGLCYNYDDKYFPGHKCKEKNIFMAISKEILEGDEETPSVSESPGSTDITPLLACFTGSVCLSLMASTTTMMA
jgi:hypothetical protein